ncbi:hypothetical protein Bbelb_232820 [Branchiostoma belcheri]|nr:hypothetical protein Bbelb_232820 [Branchiostoma belcheri]
MFDKSHTSSSSTHQYYRFLPASGFEELRKTSTWQKAVYLSVYDLKYVVSSHERCVLRRWWDTAISNKYPDIYLRIPYHASDCLLTPWMTHRDAAIDSAEVFASTANKPEPLSSDDIMSTSSCFPTRGCHVAMAMDKQCSRLAGVGCSPQGRSDELDLAGESFTAHVAVFQLVKSQVISP